MNNFNNTNDFHTPSSYLRKNFEMKKVDSGGSQQDKLDYIVSQLKERHTDQVQKYNKDRCNTFGKVLLLVNYNESGLIDRLNSGSLGSVDIQDDTIAFIMGYSESVQGHGIRYLCEYGICRNKKIISTGPMQYRGAYANEEDNRERAYNEIKIIDIDDNIITFGVKSGQQLLIRKLDTNQGRFETLETYNLAEEARVRKEEKLKKTLQSNRKENISKIEEFLKTREGKKKQHLMMRRPFITDTFAILPIVQYDRPFDASDEAYKLYIVGDDYPEPIILKDRTRSGYDRNKSRRFSVNNILLSFEYFSDDKIILLKITPDGSFYGNWHKQELEIQLPESTKI